MSERDERAGLSEAAWTHTPASSKRGGPVDHCSDCSDAAREWVEWPCSAALIVRAAVEVDRYLRGMDEGERLAAAIARAEAAEARVAAVEALTDEWEHPAEVYALRKSAAPRIRAALTTPTTDQPASAGGA